MENNKRITRTVGVFITLGLVGGFFYIAELIIKTVLKVLLFIFENPVNSIFVIAAGLLTYYQFLKTKNL